MPTGHHPRFPIAPLLEFIEQRVWRGATNDELAHLLGVERATISRWRNGHTLKLDRWRCDDYALALGAHPLRVWPNYYDDIEVPDEDHPNAVA